jgi:hypothetical protein
MIYYFVPGAGFYASQEEANIAFAANRAAFLEQEAYRFTIAKVVVDGTNTTWMNADVNSDPEDGKYQVFNTLTGKHEECLSLSAAIMRQEEIKLQFAESAFGVAPTQVDEKDVPHLQNPRTIPVAEL